MCTFSDPPEVSSAQRAVFSGPGDRDVLKVLVVEFLGPPSLKIIHSIKSRSKKFHYINFVTVHYLKFIDFSDPPEVSSAQRAVFSGPGDRDVLTCIVKAEPRANVSKPLQGHL